jgi:hypothetical protein
MVTSSEQLVEFASERLGVNHNRIITIDIEDADLEQLSVSRWADQHDQLVLKVHPSHRVTHGVPNVCVGDAMLSRWLAYPHLDNIACLARLIGVLEAAPYGYMHLRHYVVT